MNSDQDGDARTDRVHQRHSCLYDLFGSLFGQGTASEELTSAVFCKGRSHEEEEKRINKELAHIRQKFKGTELPTNHCCRVNHEPGQPEPMYSHVFPLSFLLRHLWLFSLFILFLAFVA